MRPSKSAKICTSMLPCRSPFLYAVRSIGHSLAAMLGGIRMRPTARVRGAKGAADLAPIATRSRIEDVRVRKEIRQTDISGEQYRPPSGPVQHEAIYL
jgi:hypothetical protein